MLEIPCLLCGCCSVVNPGEQVKLMQHFTPFLAQASDCVGKHLQLAAFSDCDLLLGMLSVSE